MSFTRQGSLTLYIGPMFSGKTKRLIDDLTRYADSAPLRVCYINTVDDQREVETVQEGMTSHSSGSRLSHKVIIRSVKHLNEVDVDNFDVLGIDETQFFTDAYDTVVSWLEKKKIVICSGLDGDFRRQPFGDVLRLIPHSESTTKCCANCVVCLKEWMEDRTHFVHPAPFTKRTIASEEVKLVGGADAYIPVCRFHFDQ